MNEKTKNALLSIVASLVCIVIGLLVGFIILYCINAENAVDGFTRIIKGGFYLKPKGIGSEIAQSAPLIMTGLSVAFAFKTGLFNIGAAGQYTIGVFGALYFAIILHMPWYVCLLAAMVCGAIWGAVPGIFKAYFNVNEVITSIMFNWIGLYLVNELMYNTIPGMYDQKTTRTYKLSSASPKSLIPDCGMNSIFRTSSTTIAIFIAIARCADRTGGPRVPASRWSGLRCMVKTVQKPRCFAADFSFDGNFPQFFFTAVAGACLWKPRKGNYQWQQALISMI